MGTQNRTEHPKRKPARSRQGELRKAAAGSYLRALSSVRTQNGVAKLTAQFQRRVQRELHLSDGRWAEHVAVWRAHYGVRKDRGDLVFIRPDRWPQVATWERVPTVVLQDLAGGNPLWISTANRDVDVQVPTSSGTNVVDQSWKKLGTGESSTVVPPGSLLEEVFGEGIVEQLTEDQRVGFRHVIEHYGVAHARHAVVRFLLDRDEEVG